VPPEPSERDLLAGRPSAPTAPSARMESVETTTNSPAQTAVSDAVTVALVAGHAPDALAVHAAQLGLTKLEKPMTIAEAAAAAAEDGFLTAVVEVSLYALLEGRAYEEAGEERTTRSPARWSRSTRGRRRWATKSSVRPRPTC
jgi:hypothetical protein